MAKFGDDRPSDLGEKKAAIKERRCKRPQQTRMAGLASIAVKVSLHISETALGRRVGLGQLGNGSLVDVERLT